MRIRTIKPEWLDDERLLAAGSDARVISVALILLADDHGRGRGSDAWLAARIFPGDPESLAKVREGLARLSGWFASRYMVDGQTYFEIKNWQKHQRVDKPGKPQVPAPRETLAKVPETLAPDLDREGKGRDLDRERSARDGSPESVDPPEPNPVLNRTDLEQAFAAARKAAGGGAFKLQLSEHRSAEGALDVLNAQPDPRAAMATVLRNFFAAGWTRDRGWTWRDFAGSDPGRWLVAGKGAPAKGPAKPSEFTPPTPDTPLLQDI